MSKNKNVVTTILNREDLENVAGEYVAAVLENERLTNEMERRIAALRQEYEKPLADTKAVGEGLFEDLSAWAVLHRAEIDSTGKKSLDLVHAVLGFRMSTPAVRQVKGVTVAHSAAALASAGRESWLRRAVTVDKQQILADSAAGLVKPGELRPFGLVIAQDETFFVEPRRENAGQ